MITIGTGFDGALQLVGSDRIFSDIRIIQYETILRDSSTIRQAGGRHPELASAPSDPTIRASGAPRLVFAFVRRIPHRVRDTRNMRIAGLHNDKSSSSGCRLRGSRGEFPAKRPRAVAYNRR